MKVVIDDIEYDVDGDYTIFQFCAEQSINIPCFCYHEKLNIAGNCRMCLVQVGMGTNIWNINSSKVQGNLSLACSTPLTSGMFIRTMSARVKRARESVMEFLLINHPLDCPICDQGGECDLQDLSVKYGSDRSRLESYTKTAVFDLSTLAPLVKTMMTRCINCTRCVRFIDYVSGDNELSMGGRGKVSEIIFSLNNNILGELSANIIDLCPVGALTQMPGLFEYRSWEVKSYVSIDLLDCISASVRIDIVNNNIVRIVPRLDEVINEEWITNKVRFFHDSLIVQRVNEPIIKLNGSIFNIGWDLVLDYIVVYLHVYRFEKTEVICDDYTNVEDCFKLSEFIRILGRGIILPNNLVSNDFRSIYLINKSLLELEIFSNFLFLGFNPRYEVPLLNLRIRKCFLSAGKFNAYSIGLALDHLNYPVTNLGNNIQIYNLFLQGRLNISKLFLQNDYINTNFFNTKFSELVIFFGTSITKRYDFNIFWENSIHILDKNFSFNVFPFTINKSLGWISSNEIFSLRLVNRGGLSNKSVFSYMLNTDVVSNNTGLENIIISHNIFFPDNFNQSSINLLLPLPAYIENSSSYFNIFGKYRGVDKIIHTNLLARSVTNLFEAIVLRYHNLVYFDDKQFKIFNDKFYLRSNEYLFSYKNVDLIIDKIYKSIVYRKYIFIDWSMFVNNIHDHYMSDHFCKNSKIMSLCSTRLKYTNLLV